MASVWEEIANVTNRTTQQVEQDALNAWIHHEVQEVDRGILEYVRRYGVIRPDQLESAIRDGKVEGHPAWEDVIDWTNLLEYREKLLTIQTKNRTENL